MKIWWEALIARFVPHPGCGPNSIYTRIKTLWQTVLIFYWLTILLSTLHTARNLHW